jgi:NADH-quinone oxidoreductase subunit N
METYYQILPEIIVAISAIIFILRSIIFNNSRGVVAVMIAFVAIIATAYVITTLPVNDDSMLWQGFYLNENVINSKLLLLAAVALIFVVLANSGINELRLKDDYIAVIFFALLGGMLTLSSTTLWLLYVGLELQALAFYVLAAWGRTRLELEAAIKYFILGAIASALLLMGCAIAFGVANTMDSLAAISIASGDDFGIISLLLFIIAFAFKLSIVPFHMWTPDVYQGVKLPTLAVFAIMGKIVPTFVLFSIASTAMMSTADDKAEVINYAVAIIAGLSIIYGMIMALRQRGLKRLLAWSTIANMGYLLLLLPYYNVQEHFYLLILYLGVYAVMVASILFVVTIIKEDNISNLDQLMQRQPLLGYVLIILLMSLAGFPPLLGFWPKLFLLQIFIIEAAWLYVALLLIGSFIGFAAYLRVVSFMLSGDNNVASKADVMVTTSKADMVAMPALTKLILTLLLLANIAGGIAMY